MKRKINDLNLDNIDAESSFFEFTLALHRDPQLQNVDLIATKSYYPNGLVVCCVYFDGVFYVSVSESSGDQALLDCNFPNLVGEGEGIHLRSYPRGLTGWPEVRKLSLWTNIPSSLDSSLRSREEERSKTEESDGPQIFEKRSIRNVPSKGGEDDGNLEQSESKAGLFSFRSSRVKKRNLGAFHHLVPLKKASKLESTRALDCSKSESCTYLASPWDREGRPQRKNE